MAMDSIIVTQEIFISDNGRMANNMELVFGSVILEILTMDHGVMER